MEAMMDYRNHTFDDGAEVVLDDNSFAGCHFKNCVLVYSGGLPPDLRNNQFSTDIQFVFRGAAENTVYFLKAMAAPKSGLQSIIQNTFPALVGH